MKEQTFIHCLIVVLGLSIVYFGFETFRAVAQKPVGYESTILSDADGGQYTLIGATTAKCSRGRTQNTDWCTLHNLCMHGNRVIAFPITNPLIKGRAQDFPLPQRFRDGMTWEVRPFAHRPLVRNSQLINNNKTLLFVEHWDFNYGYILKDNILPLCDMFHFRNMSLPEDRYDTLFVISDRGYVKPFNKWYLQLFATQDPVQIDKTFYQNLICWDNIDIIGSRFISYANSRPKMYRRKCIDYLLSEARLRFGSSGQGYLPASGVDNREPIAIYIQRAGRRGVLNEDEIVGALISRGIAVKVVKFEHLPIQEQMFLMRNATLLVAMHGAGIMNGVFLPVGASVIQLIPAYMGYPKDYAKFVNYGAEMAIVLQSLGIFYFEHRSRDYLLPRNSTHSYKRVDTRIDIATLLPVLDNALSVGINSRLMTKTPHRNWTE